MTETEIIDVTDELGGDAQHACEYMYAFRPGRTARVIRGRKIPIGTTVRIETFPVDSAFNRGAKSVRTSAGWTDTNNMEIVPESKDVAEVRPLLCGCCKTVKPAERFIYSAWDGFGSPRCPRTGYTAGYSRYQTDGHCVECEAADLSGFVPGTDGHTLAVAVLAGELSAVLPLIDELISDGNEYQADELKRLHKLDKPARKPRKAKAVAG